MKTTLKIYTCTEYGVAKRGFYMYLDTLSRDFWMPSSPEFKDYHDACQRMFHRIYRSAEDNPDRLFVLE
jgi:hypothetical protein